MPSYTVDKDVPMPAPGNRPGAVARYPFRSMEIGDSFFVPEGDFPLDTVRRAAVRNSEYLGRTFKAAKMPGGVRVWRFD